MSRSHKKVAILKGGGYGKFGKRLANKRVRADKAFDSDFGGYKRMYQSYEIYDYRFSPEHKYAITFNELKNVDWKDKGDYIRK